jgi:hypothetical protein
MMKAVVIRSMRLYGKHLETTVKIKVLDHHMWFLPHLDQFQEELRRHYKTIYAIKVTVSKTRIDTDNGCCVLAMLREILQSQIKSRRK